MVPFVLGWPPHSQSFDLALHLGSSIAVVWFFWREWLWLAAGFFRGLSSAEVRSTDPAWRMSWLIIVATIPAGVAGVLLEKPVEELFRGSVINAILLLIFAGLLAYADYRGSRSRSMSELNFGDAIWVGLAQVLALMPGVSRSGITITASLFRGLDRATSARYSFLMSGPVIVAAALFKLREGVPSSELQPMVLGTAAAAITGWAAIGFMLRYLRGNTMTLFVAYRILFGVLVLAVAAVRLTT